MKFNIGFYIHHHGAGHFTRIAQLATKLAAYHITVLGSNLQPYAHLLPPEIEVIHLPYDIPRNDDVAYDPGTAVDVFHYAPLNVAGLRARNVLMTEFFQKRYPLVFVVDVSVEVTLLARLCGIPTVVTLQHGRREDMPHEMAYQSAACILAPFSNMMSPELPPWIMEKTIFTGGFSKYRDKGDKSREIEKYIAVMTGSGGTSIDGSFILFLAQQCKAWHFHFIGRKGDNFDAADNVSLHGQLDDPHDLLEQCSLVIGNTGHNTVMEMASLGKRFIGIPEERPFAEQVDKARTISALPGVRIVDPSMLYDTNWHGLLSALLKEEADWKGVVADNALDRAANAIICTGNSFFNSSSATADQPSALS